MSEDEPDAKKKRKNIVSSYLAENSNVDRLDSRTVTSAVDIAQESREPAFVEKMIPTRATVAVNFDRAGSELEPQPKPAARSRVQKKKRRPGGHWRAGPARWTTEPARHSLCAAHGGGESTV